MQDAIKIFTCLKQMKTKNLFEELTSIKNQIAEQFNITYLQE